MRVPRADWDNEYEDRQGLVETAEACQLKCGGLDRCLQYAYSNETKSCNTSSVPKLGQAKPGVRSGWLPQRIEQYVATIPACRNEAWLS